MKTSGRSLGALLGGGFVLLLFITGVTNVAAQTGDMFGAPIPFRVGVYPGSVAVGDFNADGKPDLAVANLFGPVDGGGEVSVLLGHGDGCFQAAVNYGPQASPRTVAVGDFNGDGKQDLALANSWSGGFRVLLGNGDGTFEQILPDYRNNGAGFSALAIADLNADGRQDVLIAPGSAQTFLGNGDGTFIIRPWQEGIPTDPVLSVALADLDGDGNIDLAVAGYVPYYDPENPAIDNVAVLRGNGDGTFRPPVKYAAGSAPYSVALGDFNADGNLDLAVANSGSNNVSVLRGNGDGTFQPSVSYAVGSIPKSVAVGDMDGDGQPDLVVANSGSDNVSVLRGNEDGTFQAAVNYAAGSVPYSVAVGDFNGDGRLDLAVTNVGTSNDTSTTPNDVSVLLGNTGLPAKTCNATPMANAGADQDVAYTGASGTVVALDGSASSDPDGDSLTYTWTGPFTGGGGTTTGVSPTVALPLGKSTITLVVNDGTVDSPPDTVSVVIKYAFSGFFQPVDNLPTMNAAKAGSAIPVKWSLGGNWGLSIFAAGYPLSRQIACDSGAILNDIEETVTAGGSSLSFDLHSGQYNYVWKTDKAWAPTCRQLVLKLADGTMHAANFKLK